MKTLLLMIVLLVNGENNCQTVAKIRLAPKTEVVLIPYVTCDDGKCQKSYSWLIVKVPATYGVLIYQENDTHMCYVTEEVFFRTQVGSRWDDSMCSRTPLELRAL